MLPVVGEFVAVGAGKADVFLQTQCAVVSDHNFFSGNSIISMSFRSQNRQVSIPLYAGPPHKKKPGMTSSLKLCRKQSEISWA